MGGYEGHEGKAGQRHRQGQERQGCCLPWLKSEDRFWPDQGQAHQEQVRQDCVQSSSAHAKKSFASSGLKAWCDAVKAARKALNLNGFVAVGGKSATGKALYAKAKALLK